MAHITIEDPSDVIDPQDWAVDNAIIPDYNVPFLESQPSDSMFTLGIVFSRFGAIYSTHLTTMLHFQTLIREVCSDKLAKVVAAYSFDANSSQRSHETLAVDANDTSVILVANGASLDLSFVDVIKYGYASNLLEASFWGFNAAVNVVSAPCFFLFRGPL